MELGAISHEVLEFYLSLLPARVVGVQKAVPV